MKLPNLLYKHFLLSLVLPFAFLSAFSQTKTLRYDTPIGVNCNGFYEYLPKDYNVDPNKKFPLVIYIHGLGVIGNGKPGQLEWVVTSGWGTIPWRTYNTTTFPTSFDVGGTPMEFILVTPQFLSEPWSTFDRDFNAVIDYCESHYRVDANRIYLAGQSSGGQQVMDFVGASFNNANRIAAVLSSSPAGGAAQYKANNISAAQVAVWMTASEQDDLGGGAFKDAAYNWQADINNATPRPVYSPKVTILPGSHTHNDAAIYLYDPKTQENGVNAYQWMLGFSKRSVLPVTGLNLTAKQTGTSILLEWKTQFETNNKGFNIEISSDGAHFKSIGFVPTAGNNSGSAYQFRVSNPYSQVNYFRLAQTDLDEKTTYSNIVNIRFDAPGSIVLSPNPVQNLLQFEFNAPLNKAIIQIFDGSGRLWKVVNPGNARQGQIDVSGLANGLFNVRIINNGKTNTFAIIKQ